ncbi:hypothetical protein KW536_00205 [Vibrio fluvialis]|nr:hypothetical protein [Vibrio fluvialis]
MKHSFLLSLRCAFFFKEPIIRPDQSFYELTRILPVFDTMPQMNSLPQGINIDNFPLMKLSSSSGIFNLDISHRRMDLFINLNDNIDRFQYEVIHAEFLNMANIINNYIGDNTRVILERLGVVVEYFVSTNLPVEVVKKASGLRTGDDIYEAGVRLNYRRNYCGIKCNDVLSCETGAFKYMNEKISGTLFVRDVNTTVEDTQQLTSDDIAALLFEFKNKLSEQSFEGFIENGKY